MGERRHFKAKRTSLFGSENEENPPEDNSFKTSSKLTINKNELKSINYGDWWKPTEKASVVEIKPSFFGRTRVVDNFSLNEIEGFKDRPMDSNAINDNETGNLSGNIPDKIEALSEKTHETLQELHSSRSVRFEDKIKDDRSDSEHNDIVEEAENRAKERQQQQTSRKESNKYLDRSGRSSPPKNEMAHSTTDNSNEAQKELLERKMSERAPEFPSPLPPWPIAKTTQSRSPLTPRFVPNLEKKFSFQKSCNQIEFPRYTPEEMRRARPAMVDSRNKKCTWMPSLAADFVSQSDVGKKSAPRRNKQTSPRYTNGVYLSPYPKLTAPYAID
ncbi:hypothetical protein Aperf_G00000027094 [Anoplocephala perfoliata]